MRDKIIKNFDNIKPISGRITLYAFGTAIEGIAVGLYFGKNYPILQNYILMFILFIIGAIMAITSYKFIKTNVKIEVKNNEN